MTCIVRTSRVFACAVLILWLFSTPTNQAQLGAQTNTVGSIPRTPDGKPDLTGIWDAPGSAHKSGDYPGTSGAATRAVNVVSEEPSMTAWAKQIFARNRRGIVNPREHARLDLDPSQWCYPPGPARLFTNGQPFEIRQQPKRLLLLFEHDHWAQRIWTDGREQPEGYPTSFMGYSIGKWDGDTLISETTALDPRPWLDSLGHPQSDELRLIERFRRVNHDTLQVEITFVDSKAYTKPWTQKITYELMPPGYEIMEHVECAEWLEIDKLRQPERFPIDVAKFYDRAHPIQLTGKVTKIEFIEPYVQIHFTAKDKSGVESSWVAETASPQQLYRAGWTPDALKPGDTIPITGFPARNGQKKIAVQKLVAADGKVLSAGAE